MSIYASNIYTSSTNPSQREAERTSRKKILLPLAHNLRNRMSYHRARFFRLLFRQPSGDANFQRRSRLPSRVAGVDAKANGEGFETRNENAVCEALWSLGRGVSYGYVEELERREKKKKKNMYRWKQKEGIG